MASRPSVTIRVITVAPPATMAVRAPFSGQAAEDRDQLAADEQIAGDGERLDDASEDAGDRHGDDAE
ncbi:hypothetical protein [Streptomyces sp. NPDC003015]